MGYAAILHDCGPRHSSARSFPPRARPPPAYVQGSDGRRASAAGNALLRPLPSGSWSHVASNRSSRRPSPLFETRPDAIPRSPASVRVELLYS
eukprot:scaffold270825_cov39-Tisochrysis_lutea.AAC.1